MNKHENYRPIRSYWFSEIPSHWKTLKNKYIFLKSKDIVGENWKSFTLLTMGKSGVKPRDMTAGGKFPESFEKYQIVNVNQLIFCLFDLDETPRTVGISQDYGMITSAYDVFSVTVENEPRYWNYFYQSIDDYKGLKPFYTGLRKVVRLDVFMGIEIYLPPLQEQKLIARYLDKKIAQIDLLIEKISKKIQLLKEKRTALINQCVTKGLDPNVAMKDSGIEWIGKIPQHWGVTRLKFHGEILIGLSFDKADIVDSKQGILVLRSSNVQKGKVSFYDNIWVKTKVPEKLYVKNGDILICSRNGSRNLIGKNCLLGKESIGMTWGVFMSVYRTPRHEFLYWILNSQVFTAQSGLYLTSTINQLTVSVLKNLIFPFSPEIEEQNLICKYLNKQTIQIGKLIDKFEKKIKVLKEYRQALISSVVTGKVRVTESML